MAYEDGVFATFYDEAIQDEQATEEQGIPVFNERLFINIKVPNQVDNISRPATEIDQRRFPKSYEAYVTGKEPADSGIPLTEWPQLTVSELKVCQAVGLKTVNQLADLPDSGMHRLGMGGQSLKNRAMKFLTKADENDRLRSRIEELESKIAKMSKKGDSSPTKRKVVRVAAQ